MARPSKIELVTGDVVNVQFSSETHVSGDGRRGFQSRISNKMRLFLMVDGKEQHHDFINCTVGVREGHRVSLAVGRRTRSAPPVRLMLVNHTTGQREELAGAMRQVLDRKPWFGPWTKAVLITLLVQTVGWLVWTVLGRVEGNMGPLIGFTLISTLGMVPLLAFGLKVFDHLTRKSRLDDDADRLRAEIEGRLHLQSRANAPAPNGSMPTP